LGYPEEITRTWSKHDYMFSEKFCWLRSLGGEMCSNASILIITAFTIERYIALCKPFARPPPRTNQMYQNSIHCKVTAILVVLWFAGLGLAVMQTAYVGLFPEFTCDGKNHPYFKVCTVDPDYPKYSEYSFQASTYSLFVIPMILIGILCTRMCITLKENGRNIGPARVTFSLSADSSSPSARISARSRVLSTIVQSNQRPTKSNKTVIKILGKIFQ
jgi:neuromedin U receptor 1